MFQGRKEGERKRLSDEEKKEENICVVACGGEGEGEEGRENTLLRKGGRWREEELQGSGK